MEAGFTKMGSDHIHCAQNFDGAARMSEQVGGLVQQRAPAPAARGDWVSRKLTERVATHRWLRGRRCMVRGR